MKNIHLILILFFLIVQFVSPGFSADEKFNSDKMMDELETQLDLSGEKVDKLKPAIDAKSADLKKSLHEALDKGFVELDELTAKLDMVSKDAEEKVKAFLNSEEMEQLKSYLKKIDKEAIDEAKEKLVAELTALLELTEEQIAQLKPILEESMTELSGILKELASEGSKSWENFKEQYEKFSKTLREKLENTLDGEQMKKFDKYQEEKKEKIHQVVFSA